ncbi:AfsR/SARP family transcriptional regulator [Streptosporangium sp. V21-05]|uniref:AfsR/SARP family transcriptional regulator n=1 Tax=Streptosporangium sp. V21-05 TaxID=3446115 RepID=UPI003F52ECE8
MRFGVMGPLEVTRDGLVVPVSAVKQRVVLATLLLHANRPVSLDLLIERIWDGTAEREGARAAVQAHVGRLRGTLQAGLDGPSPIRTRDHGYSIEATPDTLDVTRFQDLVSRAAEAGDAEEEGALLRRALTLSRGPILANVPSASLHQVEVAWLTEEHLRAQARWFDVGLRLGRHDELISELRTVTATHPLREPFWAQLMLALHRSGRQAEALRAYESVVTLLREELGIDPGGELRRLHQAVLSDDPELALSPAATRTAIAPPAGEAARADGDRDGPPVPSELPADAATFVGRRSELRLLHDVLTGDGPRSVAVVGAGGTGKSALAVHAAHGVAERFPDGRLYVNLHGATPNAEPLEPQEVLRRFLRSLSAADSTIPTEAEEAAGRFRSFTSGRRVLVVLDNARDAAQVRLLLPGGDGCGVLITSRRGLGSLDGVTHQRLGMLPDEEALSLFARLVGSARVAGEPGPAAEVVRQCGNLPLAVRIAAARLTNRPAWRISTLAGRLAAEHHRLSELRVDDHAVRASFMVSYEDLTANHDDADAARVFRLLGVLDLPDVSVPVAAALAAVPDERAEDLLDRLVDMQLVENPAPGRYAMHDLLRLFARERAAEQESREYLARAVERVWHHYVATARTATAMVHPKARWRTEVGLRAPSPQHPDVEAPSPRTAEPATDAEPITDAEPATDAELTTKERVYLWTDAETCNVLAVVAQATRAADHEVAAALAAAFAFPLYDRGRWGDQLELFTTAVRSAESSGEPGHLALAYSDRGRALSRLGHLHKAIDDLRRSLEVYRRLGNHHRAATQLEALGGVYRRLGDFENAIGHYRQALDGFREHRDHYQQGGALSNLGVTYQQAGRYREAIDAHTRSIAFLRDSGDTLAAAAALGNLAEGHRLAGEAKQAAVLFEETLALDHREGLAGTYWEAEHLWGFGRALRDLGEDDEAGRCWRRSAEILLTLRLIGVEERDAIVAADHPPTPEIIERHL